MEELKNKKLQTIVAKVLRQAGLENDEQFGSIITILMMISIIVTVIRVIQECNKEKLTKLSNSDKYSLFEKQIKSYSSRRGWFTKMRLRKILRNKLSPEAYKKYQDQLVQGILKAGEDLNREEIITLMEESNV